MPMLDYPFEDWTAVGALPADANVAPGLSRGVGPRLRRLGHDGVSWDPDGDLVAEAVFVTPLFQMDALTEVIGIGAEVYDRTLSEQVEGHVSVQVTLDNGATYLTWDGGAWVGAAEGGDYTELRTFDENCAALTVPEEGAKVGFRVKLEALGKDPVIRAFVPYFEWDHNELLDLFTTLRRALSGARFPVLRKTQLAVATDRVTPDVKHAIDQTVDGRVFNLTDDPNKTTDLFDSWDNGVMVLTAAQALDDILQIELTGTARITVTQRSELVDLTEIPQLRALIGLPRVHPRSWSGEIRDVKDGTTTRWQRRRLSGPVQQYRVDLSYWAARPRDAIRGAKQMRVAVEGLRSSETGTKWRVDVDAAESLKESISDGLFGGELAVAILLRVFPTSYTQEKLVEEIVVRHVNRPDEQIEVVR